MLANTKQQSLADVQSRIAEIKPRAEFFMKKRRSDVELYRVIADVMQICEIVDRENLQEDIKSSLKQQEPEGRNRIYTMRDTDVYVIVGRAVFEPQINRGTSWRYSSAMREAGKRGLQSHQLVDWLSNNGGINTLFKGRGVLAQAVTTKTLHLNSPVNISKHKPITITLKMDHRGFFDVVEVRS